MRHCRVLPPLALGRELRTVGAVSVIMQRAGCIQRRMITRLSIAEPSTAADALQRPLRSRFQARLSASVRCQKVAESL